MNKTVYAILMILFNHLGVPDFINGDTKTGIIKIVLCLIPIVGWWILSTINIVMGIIMAIKIFKMTEEEFQAQKETLVTGWPVPGKKVAE